MAAKGRSWGAAAGKREAGAVRLTAPAPFEVFTHSTLKTSRQRCRQPHSRAAARRFEDRKEKQFMYSNHYGYNTTDTRAL